MCQPRFIYSRSYYSQPRTDNPQPRTDISQQTIPHITGFRKNYFLKSPIFESFTINLSNENSSHLRLAYRETTS